MSASQEGRPRKGLGVSGFLSEGCHIFYENLGSSLHVGRVSDLLSAKLKKDSLDELKLRALLLFGYFEAHRSAETKKEGYSPVLLECGMDAETAAIGVSYVLASDFALESEGLTERVLEFKTKNSFEELLGHIHRHSDRFILRYHSPSRRVELIALLTKSAQSSPKVEVEILNEDIIPDSASAGSYTALADLDYEKLLTEETQEAKAEAPAIATNDESDPEVIRIRGQGSVDPEKLHKISHVTLHQRDDVVVVEGDGSDLKNNDVQVVSNLEEIPEDTNESQDQALSSEGLEETSEEMKEMDSEPSLDLHSKEEQKEALSKEQVIDALEASAKDLDHIIVDAQKNAASFKDDLADRKIRRWFDGMMSELIAEKSRLHEMAEHMATTLRQMELEFKNRERTLEQDVRRRDSLLRQKSSALLQAKEQIAQMSMTIEKMREEASSDSDPGHYRQKYLVLQKILSTTREENAQLEAKVSDLRNQLSSAQVTTIQQFSQTSGANSELKTAKLRLDRAVRQVEDLKKTNQRLMDKLSERTMMAVKGAVAGNNASGNEDLKKKLDAASKMLNNYQRESVQQLNKIEDLQKEKMRLKMQLSQALAELKGWRGSESA